MKHDETASEMKPRHVKSECPESLKKTQPRWMENKQKAMVGTWSEEEDDEDEKSSESEESHTKICLMARGEEGDEEEILRERSSGFGEVLWVSCVASTGRVHSATGMESEQAVGGLPKRWSANFDYDKDPSMMPIWVGFPGLQVSLYNEDYLRSVANNLGQVLCIHETTLAWTQTAEALVCIDVDIAAPLQHKIWIGYGDQGFWQKVNYHRVPPLCKFCCRVGHSEDSCFKKNKKPMPPQSTKAVGASEVVAQPAQEWRPVRGHKKKVVDVRSNIPVSNAFECLRDDVGELVIRVEDRVAGDDRDGVI
ncbi:hypothetical protein Taro_026390 [Colocasia esculenta]|uniref:DUF4283 domain-containing protein n=1 Tax=Colocasia esculenta TaxID=4460 RepID=A0A843V616_COLES|nr:hypothetical protein [Colocasia esculenta]